VYEAHTNLIVFFDPPLGRYIRVGVPVASTGESSLPKDLPPSQAFLQNFFFNS